VAWTDSIQMAINNLAATLAIESAAPKPSYSLHGHSVDWDEYRQSLIRAMADLRQQLSQGLPWEGVSVAR
jgi:hypothetical protein